MFPVRLHGVVLGSGRHTALPVVHSRESLAGYQAEAAPLTMSWKMREISRALRRIGTHYHMAPNLSHFFFLIVFIFTSRWQYGKESSVLGRGHNLNCLVSAPHGRDVGIFHDHRHHHHHHLAYHGVGPFVDPFRWHTSRSLFTGLPWVLLPGGL